MYPWVGEAKPMSRGAMTQVADILGCEVAVIKAVWEVEASSRGFYPDGSVIRRFEPHKMPGSNITYKQSLKIGPIEREKMFLEAYAKNKTQALRATSWGGPQIMGFNHNAAGFSTVQMMVEAMAESEDQQLWAFCTLIQTWGLATVIRAHDWNEFELRYNGGGQNGVYARKIEAAYRKYSGKASPVVLKIGSNGKAVKELQYVLGMDDIDGIFGPTTDRAVRNFQASAGLKVDGIVGKRTWEALEHRRQAKPARQETPVLHVADRVKKWGGAAAAVSGAVAIIKEQFPDETFFYAAIIMLIVAAGAMIFRQVRN